MLDVVNLILVPLRNLFCSSIGIFLDNNLLTIENVTTHLTILLQVSVKIFIKGKLFFLLR